MVRYTREQLLFYLKKLASELGRTPKISDMKKTRKYPSPSTYSKRFSSWNSSLKEAGLKINLRNRYEKKELAEMLHLLRKELGRTPKQSDLKEWTASASTFRKHFGSWEDALKASGVKDSGYKNLKEFVKKRK